MYFMDGLYVSLALGLRCMNIDTARAWSRQVAFTKLQDLMLQVPQNDARLS
jgi:hypothetical protein